MPVALARGSTPAPEWQLHVPVLYYHHIACAPAGSLEPQYWMCPDQLTAQLQYVKDAGWSVITVDQLADLYAARTCPPSKTLVVSIDDGDRDAYTNAAPILEGLGMRGSFFVIAGRDGTQGAMTNTQVADLAARGHAIGNHTLDHANLKKLDAAGLTHEIEDAQVVFQQILGYRPQTFAYPYGRFNDAVVQSVAASNFDLGFTVMAGAVESTRAPLTSKRIEIKSLDSGATVLSKIAAYADPCPGPTPDLVIGASATGPFRGLHVESATPISTEKLRRSNVKAGVAYGYYMRLTDQSNTSSSFALRLDKTAAANARVVVYVAGQNVTAAVVAGTYSTPVIAPWTWIPMAIRIIPGKASLSPPSLVVDLYATSGPGGVTDVVRAIAAY
jgi:peptidoglycan/xylan/chitin deacetylase (PgdA/CDA1 family)